MDCDDVALLLAVLEDRTLSGREDSQLSDHLDRCERCRIARAESSEQWRWVARLPDGALDDSGRAIMPTFDPILFEVGAPIASGGMGQITRARDRRLGRTVAIKEVRSPSLRARFLREVAITARLEHPGIVPVYEAGEWPDGTPFYAMRLFDGATLASTIDGAATLRERIALVAHVLAVADAVAYAHARGVIHRDLKPTNVLVGEFGETIVIDWGLAKQLDDPSSDDAAAQPMVDTEPALTLAGVVVGTPGFMAPEQARGDSIDERADVYALGAILYHVITGRIPFAEVSGELAVEIVALRDPIAIAELAPDAPNELRAIAERAMARDPAARFGDAGELAAELRRFLAGQLVRSHRYTAWELVARWVRRHRAAVAVAALAVIAVIALAAVALIGAARTRAAERDAALAERAGAAAAAAQLAEAARFELTARRYDRALAYAVAALAAGHDTPAVRYAIATAGRQARPLQAAIDPSLVSDDCRGERECAATDVLALAVVADGLVTVEADGRCSVWRNGARARTFAVGTRIESARFDPTAQRLAVHAGGQLALWEVASGRERWRRAVAAADYAFDPSGRVLAVAADDSARVAVLDAASGTATRELVADGPSPVIAWSSDGARLACAAGGAVQVWATASGASLAGWREGSSSLALAFVDDTRLVVSGGAEAALWDVATAHRRTTLGPIAGVPRLAVARDGAIAIADRNGLRLWDRDGVLRAHRRGDGATELAFAQDALLASDTTVERLGVWELPELQLRASLPLPDTLHALAISRDGTRMATAAGRHIEEWAVPRGGAIGRWPARHSIVDGTLVVVADDRRIVQRALIDGTERTATPIGSSPRAISMTGSRAVVVDGHAANSTATVVDIATGSVRGSFVAIGTPRMTPRGEFIIDEDDSGGAPQLRVYDAGAVHQRYELHTSSTLPLAFAPNDSRFAVTTPRGVTQYELATGRQLATIAAPRAEQVDYMSGDRVLVVRGNELAVFAADSGEQIKLIDVARKITSVRAARDGHSVVVVTASGDVEQWSIDGSRGRLVRRLDHGAVDATLDDDGVLIATAGPDGDLRLWDAASGQLLDTFHLGEPVRGLALSHDRLFGHGRTTAALWDVHLERRAVAELGELAASLPWRVRDGQLVETGQLDAAH